MTAPRTFPSNVRPRQRGWGTRRVRLEPSEPTAYRSYAYPKIHRCTTLPGREMRLLSLSARALLVAALPFPLLAQQVAQNGSQKKALTQADWDRWRAIQNPTLSNDGKWAAYTLSPQVGDGEFVVRATSGTTEYRVPVGFIGRPNNVPGALRPPLRLHLK